MCGRDPTSFKDDTLGVSFTGSSHLTSVCTNECSPVGSTSLALSDAGMVALPLRLHEADKLSWSLVPGSLPASSTVCNL